MNKKGLSILIILLLIIVAGGIIYFRNYDNISKLKQQIAILQLQLSNKGNVPAPNNSNNNQGETLQVYRNSTYGFEFQYPSEFEFVTPTYPNLQDKIVQLQISQKENQYPKTNFGDAAFSVSASYARSVNDCLAQNSPENGDGFKTTASINGVTFYKTNSAGVGAGNLYESNIYRAFVGNQLCLELNETIHTSNIGNYPEGTVTEVSKTEIKDRLDKILTTFKLY